MPRPTRTLAAAAAFAAAAFLLGCEDTPLTPGEDWTLEVVAQPSVVTIDPATGEAQATIIATVANDTGVPQSGVSVVFSNAGGELTSGSGGIDTDGAGRAVDTLTIRDSDPDSIEVIVTSGSLTDTVTITKSTAEPDLPPTAAIEATPPNEQVQGGVVVFDGSDSDDPDEGDVITSYRWTITSTAPDTGVSNPRVYEGAGLSSIGIPGSGRPAFSNIQDLTVELAVSDAPLAPGRPVNYRGFKTITYKIVGTSCAGNQRPVAVIAGAETQTVTGGGQATVVFQLNGSLSTDPEGAIDTYTWTCGNGALPNPSTGTSPTVTCTYVVDDVARSYTATLVVRDAGNPVGQCIQTSTADTVQVTVLP